MNQHEAIGNDDLIAFLAARLDEHEAAAQDCPEPGKGALLREVAEGRRLITEYEAANSEFSRRIDEATKDGLPLFTEVNGGPVWAPGVFAEIIQASGHLVVDWGALRQEVAGRASIWSDHPDYQPEWAPDDDGDSD